MSQIWTKSTLSVHRLYSKCPPSAWTHAWCLPRHWSILNSLVKNWLFKTAPDIDEPPFQFIHTVDLSVIDTMLHNSPDLVIHRTEIWAVWGHSLDTRKFGVSWCNSVTVARAWCGVLVYCPAGTKLLPDTLHSADSSMTSLWGRESSIEEVSKRYQENFLLCNNNEITACIADVFNSFCEEVYAVAFSR